MMRIIDIEENNTSYREVLSVEVTATVSLSDTCVAAEDEAVRTGTPLQWGQRVADSSVWVLARPRTPRDGCTVPLVVGTLKSCMEMQYVLLRENNIYARCRKV